MSTIATTGPPPVERWPEQACQGREWADFFSDGPGRAWRVENAARAVCGRCEAIRQCRAYALPIVDLAGMWGGMTALERAAERKRRQQKEAI